jgi:cell division septum initiation protein DivIVA
MANAKERLENVEYRIFQTKKLLNEKNKGSEAYKTVKRDLDGLNALKRVAKSNLKKEKDNLNAQIKLARMQLRASPSVTEKLKCTREIEVLKTQLRKLKG